MLSGTHGSQYRELARAAQGAETRGEDRAGVIRLSAEGTMRSSLLSAAGCLTILLTASVAGADEAPDAVRAAALFAEGRQLMASGDFAAACPKLAESQTLDPAPDTALDLGICYEKASQAAFKTAHELARPSAGGGAVSAPSLALAPEADAPKLGQTQRVVGLMIGGVGLAGIATGLITAVMAKMAHDSVTAMCANGPCASSALSQIKSAHDLGLASTVSLIAGAGALGAGAIVFFTAPRSKTSSGAVVGLGPATDGTGLSVAGRF
jgi:hypothetical protein